MTKVHSSNNKDSSNNKGERREQEPLMNTGIVRILPSKYTCAADPSREQDPDDRFASIPVVFLPIDERPRICSVADASYNTSSSGRTLSTSSARNGLGLLRLARIACRECGSPCSSYYPSFFCQRLRCPAPTYRRRSDGLFKIVSTGQFFGYISPRDEGDGNRYLIPHDLLVHDRYTLHFVTIFKDERLLLEVRQPGRQAFDVVLHPAPEDFYLGKSFAWEKSVDEFGRTVYNPDRVVVATFAEGESMIDIKSKVVSS